MEKVTFITGNAKKAEYLEKYLGFPVEHQKLDLDEIQSLDLCKIVEHKVRQAYAQIQKPVIVEDASLEFTALNGLPGPFVKFFLESLSDQGLCSLLQDKEKDATERCVFGYYDGKNLKLFEGALKGKIVEKPAGNDGFGWDTIFIPEGYTVTQAQLSPDDHQKVYLQMRPFEALKKFLEEL